MKNYFNINSPTSIICDSIENIDIINIIPKDVKNILIVKGMVSRSEAIDNFVNILKLKYKVCIYAVKSGEPTYKMVDEGTQISQNNNIDIIIAIGGGTKIDLAKAIAIRHYFAFTTSELMNEPIKHKIEKALKLIVIPTTAGTGSELSMGAVLTDENSNKSSLRSPLILPYITIVDPLLSTTLPRKATAITGFDVFTHAIETYFSKYASPFTRQLSEYVMQVCHSTLPELIEDLKNLTLREKMSKSSLWMGYNLANSSTCLPHRIQYTLSTYTNLEHAECLAVIYPTWLKLIHMEYPTELEDLIEIFSMGKSRDVDYMVDWIGRLHIRTNLSDQGIGRAQLSEISRLVNGNLKLDPVYKGRETIEKILIGSL
jgi:alcohol dehydrogenase class IV